MRWPVILLRWSIGVFVLGLLGPVLATFLYGRFAGWVFPVSASTGTVVLLAAFANCWRMIRFANGQLQTGRDPCPHCLYDLSATIDPGPCPECAHYSTRQQRADAWLRMLKSSA